MRSHCLRLVLPLLLLALAACSDVTPSAPESSAPESFTRRNLLPIGPGETVSIVSPADTGSGSLREAIARANVDPSITEIVVPPMARTIALHSPLVYTGVQPLRIVSGGIVLDATNAGGSALRVTGGADLEIVGLEVRNATGEGIEIQVPSHRTGTVRVSLQEVTIANNRGHGVLINDQTDPSTPEDANGEPLQPNPAGSPASIDVTLRHVVFERNGYSVSDRDGLRVNEGGAGDLRLTSDNVIARDNAADGIELDERGTGDVVIAVHDLGLFSNGRFDPEDLDDGFDIDETDEGSITGFVSKARVIDNFEEGLDFNENNLGDLRVAFNDVVVTGSGEEGIDLEEDDETVNFAPLGGDLAVSMIAVVANGNGKLGGDGGLKLREKAAGNLTGTIALAQASNNFSDGINAREDADGALTLVVRNSIANGNGVGTGAARRGIVFDERGAGDLTARLLHATANNNSGTAMHVNQQTAGSGSFELLAGTFEGNVGGVRSGNVQ